MFRHKETAGSKSGKDAKAPRPDPETVRAQKRIERVQLQRAKEILQSCDKVVESVVLELKKEGYQVKVLRGIRPLTEHIEPLKPGEAPAGTEQVISYFTVEEILDIAKAQGLASLNYHPSTQIPKIARIFSPLIRFDDQRENKGGIETHSWKEPQITIIISKSEIVPEFQVTITPAQYTDASYGIRFVNNNFPARHQTSRSVFKAAVSVNGLFIISLREFNTSLRSALGQTISRLQTTSQLQAIEPSIEVGDTTDRLKIFLEPFVQVILALLNRPSAETINTASLSTEASVTSYLYDFFKKNDYQALLAEIANLEPGSSYVVELSALPSVQHFTKFAQHIAQSRKGKPPIYPFVQMNQDGSILLYAIFDKGNKLG